MRQPKNESDKRLLPLLLIGVAGLLLWFGLQPEKTPSQRGPDAAKIDGMVNRHLLMTNKTIELEQERAQIENFQSVPAVGEQILPRVHHGQKGVDQSFDRNEMNAANDLRRAPELNTASPDAMIQSEMLEGDLQQMDTEEYRREYARQFIENARAAGYEIQLDANMVVTGVKKIRPQKPDLFQGQGGNFR